MPVEPLHKQPWERPTLRSEEVRETLTRPCCRRKPHGHGGWWGWWHRRRRHRPPWGPAFS